MESLLNFLHNESITSPFRAELSNRGGYITFSNSGRRGDTKYFQIGIDSILSTLQDILNNIAVFSRIQDYDEKPWRDNGSIYFSDPVANANSTVQTKPLFSTLSKIIKWANQPFLNNLNTDNRLSITPETLENAITKLNAVADSFVPHSNSKTIKSPLDEPLQVIYYGAPGTGKSFTIDDITDDKNSVRTTFHPDSDYASFVGAYKPTMENVPINSIYGESVQFATGKNGHPGTEKKIVYKYVPQAFLKAYVAAWSNLDKPYFLIIEEINRGNCAQIFGDLFQLLDRNNAGSSSYAIHADEDISQFLSTDKKGFKSLSEDQKEAIRTFVLHKDNSKTQNIGQDILDGKLLLLPPNLYIWATMNTSDQSLFPIDSAFKRRWNWKYMPIEYNPLDKKTQQPIDWKFQIGDNLYSWGQFLSVINPEILTLTESSDKQMGYFFAKADNATGIISEDVFLNKVLFYLWTDVFKDFDISSELFRNKDKNRSFIFTDFFDKEQPNALANFIDNLNLDLVEDIEHVGEIQNEKGEWVQPTFEVEGETIASMIDTVLTVLKLYFEKYPDISTDKAIEEWNSFGMPKHALETEEVFNERTDSSKNRASKIFYTPDGRKFYVSAQLRKQHMDKLISKSSDWGINITRIL
ncbi:MAG: AAA family ATPase [Muribaculaceae bacterium]|nr:AAA family ATPase [Muribaculaceae bacterium]